MANPLDPIEQNRRAQYLERLYILDGRSDTAHPRHGVYTGLYQAHLRRLVAEDMAKLLGPAPTAPPHPQP
jgi:hypothetical protein